MSTATRLGPEYAERYAAFRREMLLDSPWAFGSSPGDDRSVDAIRAGLALPENPIFAVIDSPGGSDAARILAAAGVMREPKQKRRHIAYVWGVYVTPPARGRGLGRAVVTAAVDAARGWPDISRVQLSVSERATQARRLYESIGFSEWGLEPDALRFDGRGFAEVHMHLPL